MWSYTEEIRRVVKSCKADQSLFKRDCINVCLWTHILLSRSFIFMAVDVYSGNQNIRRQLDSWYTVFGNFFSLFFFFFWQVINSEHGYTAMKSASCVRIKGGNTIETESSSPFYSLT